MIVIILAAQNSHHFHNLPLAAPLDQVHLAIIKDFVPGGRGNARVVFLQRRLVLDIVHVLEHHHTPVLHRQATYYQSSNRDRVYILVLVCKTRRLSWMQVVSFA